MGIYYSNGIFFGKIVSKLSPKGHCTSFQGQQQLSPLSRIDFLKSKQQHEPETTEEIKNFDYEIANAQIVGDPRLSITILAILTP